ncbi:uncharacterized protein KQ657_004817 [Scheffersomyces spartinae]|uniref:Small ribosomal subunit protein uS7 domain-containing protein n=1 Tax=Scheffersomyces spartinae TaxID=45513 RepID=A0A9P7VB30_9ASCO|nr:uncharacterized protein KQ657_004817 [Scheffersomyces spartinae]KAG7194109.1 hypothetical protein KQ657_004817 [Scheffersomyces spartinae]
MIRNSLKVVQGAGSKIWLPVQQKSVALCVATAVRFNSNKASTITKSSLTAQVYPINKESISEKDVDDWLAAVKSLRQKHHPETEAEVYVSQLADPHNVVVDKFEPSQQQIEEAEALKSFKIPGKQDALLSHLTNLIMRSGKKARAEKIVHNALYIVYLKTRQDPVALLYDTVNRLAPVVTTRVKRTGHAKNYTVPVALRKRQAENFALKWIIEGSEKKRSPDFSVRLAEEIISAFEGKSAGYDKRSQMHKAAMTNRSYVFLIK